MNRYYLIGVLVMAIFTYLPRMLPLTFFRKEIKSPFIQSVLYYVPYAVLAAMTFPSIFYASKHIVSAVVGCIVAIVLAYKEKSLLVVAMGAMMALYITNIIIQL